MKACDYTTQQEQAGSYTMLGCVYVCVCVLISIPETKMLSIFTSLFSSGTETLTAGFIY